MEENTTFIQKLFAVYKELGFLFFILGLTLFKIIDYLLKEKTKESKRTLISSFLAAGIAIIIILTFAYLDFVIKNLIWIIFSSLSILCFVLFWQNRKLNKQIEKNQQQYGQTNTPIPAFDRFEKVFKDKELIYGFIQYRPFFWKDHITPKGIGYDLLSKIFYGKVKLRQYSYNKGKDGGNWDDIFSDLVNKKFHIIITPLFETRTRIHKFNIAYCSPLFYSNIGIYVRKKDFVTEDKMSFDNAKKTLQEKIDKFNWKAEILKGELSEQLLQKHFKSAYSEEKILEKVIPATDDDFIKVLQDVNSDNTNTGQFAFMEVFKANSILNKLKKAGEELDLVNILDDNQLLYPVSFVVRKEDTVLRNLINIRLLEMRNTLDENGISELEKAIKDIATSSDVQIYDADFAKIFIQKYDFTSIITH
jgi:hypothetical protein